MNFLQHFLRAVLSLFFISMVNGAHALSTDKEQDLEIEADTAELDDIKGITIYRGDVVVVQGSVRMTGHTMKVFSDDQGDMELVIMQGDPATYRQLPDNSDSYDEAEALQMEYYLPKDFVILVDKAKVKKSDGSTMSGSRIEYNTVLSQVKAQGAVKTTKSSADQKEGRVRIIIKKKKE